MKWLLKIGGSKAARAIVHAGFVIYLITYLAAGIIAPERFLLTDFIWYVFLYIIWLVCRTIAQRRKRSSNMEYNSKFIDFFTVVFAVCFALAAVFQSGILLIIAVL